jgi:hypothetical protein
MAVVDRAERDVVVELGVPLFVNEVSGAKMKYEGEKRGDLRSHIRWCYRIRGRGREVDQSRSSHFALHAQRSAK